MDDKTRIDEVFERLDNALFTLADEGGILNTEERFALCTQGRECITAILAHIATLGEQVECERQRLAACGTAALGYFDGCSDEYRSASLDDVLALRAENERLLAHIATLEASREVDIDALVERLSVAHEISEKNRPKFEVHARRILTDALAPTPEVPVGSWWRNTKGIVRQVAEFNDGHLVVWVGGGTVEIDYLLANFTRVNPPTPWEGE